MAFCVAVAGSVVVCSGVIVTPSLVKVALGVRVSCCVTVASDVGTPAVVTALGVAVSAWMVSAMSSSTGVAVGVAAGVSCCVAVAPGVSVPASAVVCAGDVAVMVTA